MAISRVYRYLMRNLTVDTELNLDPPDESLLPHLGGGPAGLNTRPLFRLMVERKASDLFFTPNAPIKIKIEGHIYPINKHLLSADAVRAAAMSLMSTAQLEVFRRELEIDFAVSQPGLGRFRVHVFMQRGTPSMVLRYISAELPDLQSLGLPDVLVDLAQLRRGLVLVVGATGAGKSTTLAAMINYRNEHCSDHIVTIEDPIEFLHSNKKSIVNQREVGLDTHSYDHALRGVVRAAPDVILVGEVRDRAGMQAALSLAGTGHLVLATLHANNCAETLDRMLHMFPSDMHGQVMLDLSQYLRAIVAQRLVPGVDGKRLAAMEVMINTAHIADLIKKRDVVAVKEAIASSSDRNTQSFDTALLRLYRAGRISLEEALAYADSSTNLSARINFG
jgi:twitching motility protein PilU